VDTCPPAADTQETSEYQTTRRVSRASADSFLHPKKYAKSHVKSQTKTVTLNFISENLFSIHQTEPDAKNPTASEISTTRQENKKIPPIVTTSKIYYFSVSKGVKQVIVTDISTTCRQQGIRFHFSSEQDYKDELNCFRFNKLECYIY
jgi:hypothetical protein